MTTNSELRTQNSELRMQVCRFNDGSGLPRLGLTSNGSLWDLTAVDSARFGTLGAWLALPDPVASAREAMAAAEEFPVEGRLLAPLDLQEVWGAGVTYERSKVARMEESATGGDFYALVYDAERPEIFLKCPARLAVGPEEPIHIRRDSTWDVPEPELCLVLSSAGQLVGITAGNDVSSRSIEGENPLYLPQAKTWDRCCALGPAITLADEPGFDPHAVEITLTIHREGAVAYQGSTSTARMRRRAGELAEYLFRETTFPDGALLLTGVGVVPPDEFTLQPGDLVEITMSGIGTLCNPVTRRQ
jgi:2-dehydro-3-deoxy-D-arabinonate dehydratase